MLNFNLLPGIRAAYRYRFFDIDTNTDTTFRYRYQFDPYRDIHVTILPRVRLFYNEKWRTAIKSTTHNLLQLPGGVLPMWWVIHMCRGFDPLFSLWQDRARSFWGTFPHPPIAKLSFGVQKLPIFIKIDLFGPKFNFFLDLFGSNFQRPAAHPHQFSGRVPPPGLQLPVQ